MWAPQEDTSHYLLSCPLYTDQRERLLHEISLILTPGVHPHLILHLVKDRLIEILLVGSHELDNTANLNIFKLVQDFILSTKRFLTQQ